MLLFAFHLFKTVVGEDDVIVLYRYMNVLPFSEIEQTIALGRQLVKAQSSVERYGLGEPT